MSFFSSLERSTVTQLVGRAGSQVPWSMRVLESCSCTSRRSLRYPWAVPTSVADLFIHCLVKAGLCRHYSSNGRRYSTVARYSSSAKLTPSQDEDTLEQTEIGARSPCARTGSGYETKPSSQRKDGLRIEEGSTGEKA